jgi:alanine-glyoxylate transaminase/(R)-3-amino-2-methylpropionate-pyruvate transaminase
MPPTAAPSISLPPCSFTPPPYTGPSREQVLADRQRYLSPGMITYYKSPVMLVDGHMQYLFDETGKRYLDLFAGIVSVSCGQTGV